MSDRSLLLLLPGRSESCERQRGAGVCRGELSLGELSSEPGTATSGTAHLAPRVQNLCHAGLREQLWLPLLTLQDLGPFTVLPQGSCGTCSTEGVKTLSWCCNQTLAAVAVLSQQAWAGGQGGAAFMALSWAMGPGGGVWDGDSHGMGKRLDL